MNVVASIVGFQVTEEEYGEGIVCGRCRIVENVCVIVVVFGIVVGRGRVGREETSVDRERYEKKRE